MNRVWWIRHGESNSNVGERTASAAAPILTERGWQEARRVPLAFEHAPDLLVTSSYIRTKQTASPLLEQFPQIPQQEWTIQEFTELSFAHRNNTAPQERAPIIREYWETLDPQHHDGEGAESFEDLVNRVDSALRAMDTLEGFTAVFSHGLFMRVLLWRMLTGPQAVNSRAMRQYRAFHQGTWIPNCAIVRMEQLSGHWYFTAPDVTHLGDLGATQPNQWVT